MVASSCVKVFNGVVIVGRSKSFHEPDDQVKYIIVCPCLHNLFLTNLS